MERAYHLDVQASRFLEEVLHLHAVFSADVEVVPSSFTCPVGVFLTPESALSEGTELSERIGTEKDSVLDVERHHHLGPVDHGSHDELQGMLSEGKCVPFLDGYRPSFEGDSAEELGQHGNCLGRCHDLDLRVCVHHISDEGRVVGFEMLDNEIIGSPSSECGGKVILPLFSGSAIYCIHDRDLLVEYHV